MTRNENQMYSDITSIRKSLEKIANALDNNVTETTKDIPGFEGTLDALENLTNMTEARDYYKEKYENTLTPTSDNPDPAGYGNEDDTIHNDYLEEIVKDMNHIQYLNFHHDMAFGFPSSDTAALSQHIYELEYEECLGAIRQALLITGDNNYVNVIECSGFDKERKDELAREYVIDLIKKENTTQPENDSYTYETDLQGIRVDSDHDVRVAASCFEEDYATKKDAILDYVTNEFGILGARYTDIIKFAYYLGAPNAPKYDATRDRGYYSCAFATRFGGHLIQGGKDFLVKGINKEGKERYFAHGDVDSFTDYYKRIA